MITIAKYSETRTIAFKTTLDATGVEKLQSEIAKVQKAMQSLNSNGGSSTLKDIDAATQRIKELQTIISKSRKSDMSDMLDIDKFSKNMGDAGKTLGSVYKDLSVAGAQGKSAFVDLVSNVGTLNTGLKTTRTLSDKIFTSLGNIARWQIGSQIVNSLANSLGDAYDYVKNLDDSLTQIMMVTQYSRQQMDEYAKSANQAAKALSSTTIDMTNASLVFAQQGFNLDQSQKLAEMSVKLANASQQDTATTSDQITAYMNAYNLSGDLTSLNKALDSWAEVANISAADVKEIASASQRVASAAATTGVNMDQLNAQIATIESVTREAPEEIGNGLKTLYGRFSDIKLGETLDDGVDLGTVTKTLQKIGVQVLDKNGSMRNVGDIMENLMDVWSSLDQTQKAAVAQTVAGKHQLSRFEALMNRSDLYKAYKSGSENAEGTLDEMNAKYADSLQGRLSKIQNTIEEIINTLTTSDALYPWIDGANTILSIVNKLLKSMGGLNGLVTGVSGILLKTISPQLAGSLVEAGSTVKETLSGKSGKAKKTDSTSILSDLGFSSKQYIDDDNIKKYVDFVAAGQDYQDLMSAEQKERFNAQSQKYGQSVKNYNDLVESSKKQQEEIDALNIEIADSDSIIELTQENLKKDMASKAKLLNIINKSGKYGIKENAFSVDEDGVLVSPFDDNSIYNGSNRLTNNQKTAMSTISKSLSDMYETVVREPEAFKIDPEQNVKNLKDYMAAITEASNSADEFKPLSAAVGDFVHEVESGGTDTASKLDTISTALKNFMAIIDNNDVDAVISDIDKRIEENNADISGEIAAKSSSQKKRDEAKDKLNWIDTDKDLARQNLDENAGEGTGTIKNFASQEKVNNILKAAGGLGQIAFTMSSIASIADTIRDDSIPAFDKFSSIVMSLAMTAPMAVDAFRDMSKAIGATASWASIGAVAIIALISYIIKAQEEARQAAQNVVDTADSTASANQQVYSSFDQLYEQYKKTGKVTDEFKEASDKAADTLGTQADKALAAAGAYDTLAESVKKSEIADQQSIIDAVNNTEGVGGENYKSRHGQFGNFSIQYDSNTAYSSSMMHLADAGLKDSDIYNELLDVSDKNLNGNLTDAQQLGAMRQTYADLNAELEKYGSSLEEYQKNTGDMSLSEQEWTNQTTALRESLSQVDKVLNSSDYLDYANNIQKAADAQEHMMTLQGDNGLKKVGYDKLKEYLTDENGQYGSLAKYAESLGGVDSDEFKSYFEKIGAEFGAFTEEDLPKLISDRVGDSSLSDDIQSALDESGLSLKNKLSIVASLDKDSTVESVNQTISEINQSDEVSPVDVDAKLDTTDLQSASDNKSGLDSLLSKYANSENGVLSEDDIVGIVTSHPEYLRFLQETEDGYKLNTEALEAWNQATLNQTDALDKLAGKETDMSQLQAGISEYRSNDAFGLAQVSGDDENKANMSSFYSGQLDQISDWNTQLADGAMPLSDFFTGIGSSVDDFVDKLSNATSGVNDLAHAFADNADPAAQNFASLLSSELATGMDALSRQYASGAINATEYTSSLTTAAKASIKLEQNTSGLTDATVATVKAAAEQNKSFDEVITSTTNMSDSQKEAARNVYKLSKELDDNEAVEKFAQSITDNYDAITEVFSDNGEVLDSVKTSTGGIQEAYQSTVQTFAQSVVDLTSNNEKASEATIQSIMSATGQSYDTVARWLQDSSVLAGQMMSNSAVASAAMEAGAASTQQAISDIAGGIADVITDVVGMFTSMNASVSSNMQFTSPSTQDITATDDTTGKTQVLGQISVPNLTMNLSGSGSASGGKAVSGHAKIVSMDGSGGNYSGAINPNNYTPQAIAQQNRAKLKSDLSKVLKGGISLGKLFAPSGTTIPQTSFPQYSPSTGKNGSGGGGGGGSGSPGGSGGGGSSYEPKTKDYEDSDLDRYERVNTLLDAIGNDYDKIQKEQDRLVGNDLISNMEKQIPLLQRQIDLYNEKIKIQKEEAQEVREQLESEYGVTFDEEGFISNYTDAYNRLLGNVNDLISQYNAATTEEAQDALEDQINDAEDALSDFNDKYKNYDELWSKSIKESEQQIEDLKDKIEDLAIDAFNRSVEVLDNLKDINDKYAEFQHNLHRTIDENPFDELADSAARLSEYFDIKSADNYFDTLISKYKELQANATSESVKTFYQKQIDVLNKAAKAQGAGTIEVGGTGYFDMALKNGQAILEQIADYEKNGTASLFGANSKELYDAAKTVYEQMVQTLADYWDQIDDVHEKIGDCIDDISDRIDKRVDQFNTITDQLDHVKNLVEYIYGDQAYDRQNRLLAAQYQNYQNEIADYQHQIDMWKELQSNMEKGSEDWDKVQEKITDATKNLNDMIEKSVENLKTQYENTISGITKAWVPSLSGADSDWLQAQWEMINRNNDYYMDDTNKSYNIQKLQSQYLDLLDNSSDDLGIQDKISKQMNDQLKYLREKTALSQYDVQYAQAQLEILQKQIALEEAQQNKSQMKLRRDSQGNYSYVYTQDENNVRNAQSDLLDAENNAYNMTLDQHKQVVSDTISSIVNAQSQIDEIMKNSNLSLEERQKRAQDILDSLKQYIADTSEQLSTTEKNIINDFIGMCDAMTEENKSRLQGTYDQLVAGNDAAFSQIDSRFGTSLTQWIKNIDDFNAKTDSMFNDLMSESNDYGDNIDALRDTVGGDFTDITDAINNSVDATTELRDSTSQFFEQLKNDSGVISKYENQIVDLTKSMQDAKNGMAAYKQQVDELQSKLTTKEQESAQLTAANSSLQALVDSMRNSGSNGGGSSGGGGGSDGGVDEGTALGIAKNIWTYGSWDNDPVRRARITSRYGEATARRAQEIVNEYIRSGRAGQLVDYSSSQYGYDTGGYTGTWSDSTGIYGNGKLGILHQKELVLNEDDTKNILSAVEAMRSIANMSIDGIIGSVSRMMQNVPGAAQTGISQDVHITAEFPNASSTDEIVNALLSLNDRSMQYAFKADKDM